MSCADIYSELAQYASGAKGEPYVQRVCAKALQELNQLLDTLRLEHVKAEALILENCELRARIDELQRANNETWFQDRGYA